MPGPIPEAKTVRARKPRNSYLPLIVVDEQTQTILIERTGELLPYDRLAEIVIREPSSYWIACNFPRILAELNETMSAHPGWQFRGSPRKRDVYTAAGPTGRVKIGDFVVAFFGLRGPNKTSGHWHYPLDPTVFLRRHTAEALGGQTIGHLYDWGQDVRTWCVEQGLKPTPTAGGIAGQLLRDERFYLDTRRKVPKATNARGRAALPGNHYRLYATEGRAYSATYFDLAGAHHNAALRVTFPSSDDLYARGRFKITDELLEQVDPDPANAWVRPGCDLYRNLLTRAHGLLLVYLTAPYPAPDSFPLPCLERAGRRLAWVHTNEVADLLASGGIIEGIHAAWISFTPDPGLNRYAQWALEQTAQATERRKQWLKPVLLATYGVLATKPRVSEFAYGQASSGEVKMYPAGGRIIRAVAKTALTETEMATANVIHRGMIEAHTRLEVLQLARYLTVSGCNVLSVYADSVIVEAGTQLPLIPEPWRSKGELTGLRFLAATAFVSDQLTKLPGIPVSSLQRVRLLEDLGRAMHRPAKRIFQKPYQSGPASAIVV